MGYMSVVRQTDQTLLLMKEPNAQSKVFLLGSCLVFPFFLAPYLFGIGYGLGGLVSKILLAVVLCVLSGQVLDKYETCEIDRESGEVRLVQVTWSQKWANILFKMAEPAPHTILQLDEVSSVTIEQEVGDGDLHPRQVVVCLTSGSKVGVTEVFTTHRPQEHDDVAKTISDFLGCPWSGKVVEEKVCGITEKTSDKENESSDKSSAGCESPSNPEEDDEDIVEDFEKISKEDVADFQEGVNSDL